MKYLIVGAGFTGLTVAYDLIEKGHEVIILEKNSFAGGLAAGFNNPNWQWNLEHHYHHIFRSDQDIIKLAKKLKVKVNFYKVKTSFWDGETIFQFDSFKSVLTNNQISLVDKVRTLASLGILKIVPNLEVFEKITSEKWIKLTMGEKIWEKIWEPLFRGKFHQWASDVNATWFWARIHARSQALGYFEGGFSNLVSMLTKKLIALGVVLNCGVNVKKIEIKKNKILVSTQTKDYEVDKVLITGPSTIVKSILPDIKLKNKPISSLGAITMVLELKDKFLLDNTYWVNISDKNAPFLALVEHTNMISSQYYGGKYLLYLGNYLPRDHEYFGKTKNELLKIYESYLKKINRNFNSQQISSSWIFKTDYAQSVFKVRHGQDLPEMEIVPNKIYWCGIEHVYPWDRGTNYAVKWGHIVANLMMNKVE